GLEPAEKRDQLINLRQDHLEAGHVASLGEQKGAFSAEDRGTLGKTDSICFHGWIICSWRLPHSRSTDPFHEVGAPGSADGDFWWRIGARPESYQIVWVCTIINEKIR
ncbi:MAG: hypothetical protein ACRDIY_03800, partial [Chloroflexota bacterium]